MHNVPRKRSSFDPGSGSRETTTDLAYHSDRERERERERDSDTFLMTLPRARSVDSALRKSECYCGCRMEASCDHEVTTRRVLEVLAYAGIRNASSLRNEGH